MIAKNAMIPLDVAEFGIAPKSLVTSATGIESKLWASFVVDVNESINEQNVNYIDCYGIE